MTLENFIKQIETDIQDTFTDDFIETVINQMFKNKTPVSKLACANQFGIYVFFYRPLNKIVNFQNFQNKWNGEVGYKNYSKVIQKNFSKCKQNEGFYTFYLGKSENIQTRLNEHLNLNKSSTTYSLKLAGRKHFNLDEFEVGYWLLPQEHSVPKEIKQFIITTIEQKVREELKPLIGKK